MHTVRRAGRAAASAARVVSRASPSSERRPNAAIPSIAIAASSSSLKSLGAPFIGAAAARRARWFAAPADAASSQQPAATSANDNPTSSSSLASQLRAGLDYELRNRCPNARGKQYDDFQQFLLSHLSRLSAAVGASGGGVNEGALVAELAAIAQDARRYAAMDPAHRDGLLRRLGSVLHQSQQRAAQTQQTREAPRAWQPPSRDASTTRAPEPKQRASSGAQRRAVMDAAPAPAMTSTPGTNSGVTLKPPDVIVPASALASQAAAAAAANTQPSEVPCVVVFDLETTGLNKDRNRIIEIAAVSFFLMCVWAIGMTACFFKVNVSDPSHSPMSTLVNPGRFAVPPPVVALTGITNAMVSAPAVPSFQRAAELFQEYIDEARR